MHAAGVRTASGLPSGTSIRAVSEHPLIDYTGSVYPSIRMIPYPKAGNDKLSCQHRCGRCPFGQIEMDGHSGRTPNNYIARMEWAGNPNELVIEQLNRLQNTADLLIAEVSTGKTTQIFCDQDKAWVDADEIRPFGQSFVLLSERDGWRHAYLVHRDHAEPTLLTPGNFDVMTSPACRKRSTQSTSGPPRTMRHRRICIARTSAPARLRRSASRLKANQASTPIAFRGMGEWAFHGYSRSTILGASSWFGFEMRSQLTRS